MGKQATDVLLYRGMGMYKYTTGEEGAGGEAEYPNDSPRVKNPLEFFLTFVSKPK